MINYEKSVKLNPDNKEGKKQIERLIKTKNKLLLTHAYVHWLADLHLAGFAPAFTLSFHDRECSPNRQIPVASVVLGNVSRPKNKVLVKSNINIFTKWH